MRKNIRYFLLLLGLGILAGIIAKLLDIYSTNLGNIFSELSIWILFGVIITLFSKSRKFAMIYVFLFCVGMLGGYYVTAELTSSVYAQNFIIGWTIFSLFSPVFAYFTWNTKKKDIQGIVISFGILVVTLMASIVLFDGPRWYDYVILLTLAFLLFRKKKIDFKIKDVL